MKKSIGIIIGAILIACGVLYVPGAFGIVNISFSLDGWWTLFIIIPCLNGIFTNKDKFGSIIGFAVGVLLLLAARDILEYDIILKLIVPIIIVAIGVKMIVKSVRGEQSDKNEDGIDIGDKTKTERIAMFGGRTVNFDGEEIAEAKIGAIFGGAKCNLANAKISKGSHIDVMCFFGGAEIIVPENVNIKNNIFSLFGGISDKRVIKGKTDEDDALTINGFCIFGGVDIK